KNLARKHRTNGPGSRAQPAGRRVHPKPGSTREGTDPAVGRRTTKKATPAKGVASDLQHTAVDQRPTGSDGSVPGLTGPTGEGVVIRSWFQRPPRSEERRVGR